MGSDRDGRKEDVEWYNGPYQQDQYGWTQGAAGLAHTTIEIIRDAKLKGHKTILILEDDIIFKDSVTAVVKQCLSKLPPDWEMFHLTATNTKTPRRMGEHLHRLKQAWSCQAYIIHERAYDEYLEWLELVDRPIDSVTSEKFHSKGTCYSPVINQIVTKPNVSTIRGTYINYGIV